MLTDDIKLTSQWRTCLDRARCNVSYSGVSINLFSTKDKGHRRFPPKSFRNGNKSKFNFSSMRCFNCNKKGHMGASCPFEDRRKNGNRLITIDICGGFG